MTREQDYFPTDDWATITPGQAGWHEQALAKSLDVARDHMTTGVIMLQGGRIVVEQYWPLPEQASPQVSALAQRMCYGQTDQGYPREDVASVQKSVTAILAAIAVDNGLIAFDDPVARYLGDDWARVTRKQSREITITHLMTMTSGLTESLDYEAPPGSAWKYNTGAYQNLLRILSRASGLDDNALTREWLTGPLGMNDTHWVERTWAGQSPPMMGLVTTPRDLARFALLVLRQGRWHGKQLVPSTLVEELTRPSQSFNPSYGMLFWLNTEEGYREPASTGFRPGKRVPDAPDDMIAALGQLNRFVFMLPGRDIVVVRTGLMDPAVDDSEGFARRWWSSLATLFN